MSAAPQHHKQEMKMKKQKRHATLAEWNRLALDTERVLAQMFEEASGRGEVEISKDATEGDLVALGIDLLKKHDFRGPFPAIPPWLESKADIAALCAAAARYWASEIITDRCERFACSAEDFVGYAPNE